jgi:hypothetical protein
MHNKIELTEATELNKYRDTELRNWGFRPDLP